jgi:hypothetical protein
MKCFNNVSTTLHPLKKIRSKPINIPKHKHKHCQIQEYDKKFTQETKNINYCFIGVFLFEL